MENRQKAYITILILLIFTNLGLYINMEQIKKEFKKEQSRISSNMRHESEWTRSSIEKLYYKLDEIKKQNRWIIDSDYRVIGFNNDGKSMNIRVDFTLRNAPSKSEVYILYKVKDLKGEELNRIKAKNLGGLNYTSNFKLAIDENYSLQISCEGNDKIINEDLMDINLLDKLENRFMDSGGSASYSSSEYRWGRNIRNEYDGSKILKIKKVILKVYEDNKLRDSRDITSDIVISDNGKTEYFTYEEVIDPPKSLEIEFIIEDRLGRKYNLRRQRIR